MKKLVAILLLISMLCASFVACTVDPNGDEETTAAPSGSDEGTSIDDAIAYLTTSYKDDEGKVTQANYQLPAKVVIGDVTFDVVWTADVETIQFVLENGLYTVKLPSKNETEVTYTLTATVKDAAGKTATKTFTRVLPVYDNSANISEPEEGVVYKLFMIQANAGNTFFLKNTTQSNQNKYVETSTNPADGAEFQVEKVDGGYKIYTMIDGVKNYLYAKTVPGDDGKVSKYIGYSAENSSVYVYHADVNAWFTTIDNVDYVVGSYSDYTTISISEASYITAENTGVSQFVMAFMTKADADKFVPEEGPKDPTELTSIADFLTIANALANQAATPEKYLVKGTVTEIVKADYGNLYIEDDKGNKLYIYGTYSADGSKRYDAMDKKPQVGDVITVMGVASNYNGPQMKNAWVQSIEGHTCTYTTLTAKCDVCGEIKTHDCADANSDYKCDACDEIIDHTFVDADSDKKCDICGVSKLTIAEVLAAADDTKVLVSGTVSKINYNWSAENGNMSVTIKSADGKELYIYKLATEVKLGDTITVTGVVDTYNDAKQIAAGATAVVDAAHGDEHVYTNECDKDCDVCGFERAEADIPHKWTNDCDVACDGEGCTAVRPESCKDENGDDKCDKCGEDMLTPEQLAEKHVAYVKENLTWTTTAIDAAGEYDLPTNTTYEDITITWTSSDAAVVVGTNGKITVTLGDEAKEVTLTATIKSGDKSDAKTFTITVAKKGSAVNNNPAPGTATAPTNVSAALEAVKDLAAEAYSDTVFYIEGIITVNGTVSEEYFKNITISDGTKEILIYKAKLASGITGISKGDKIVVCGYIQNYKPYGSDETILEVTDKDDVDAEIISVIDGCVAGHTWGTTFTDKCSVCDIVKDGHTCAADSNNDGFCDTCGAVYVPQRTTVLAETFNFANGTTDRTSFDETTSEVWTVGDATLTHAKGGSSLLYDTVENGHSNIRFYGSDTMTIACTDIAKVVIIIDAGHKDSKGRLDSFNADNAIIEIDGTNYKVTITFANLADSVVITNKNTAQVRITGVEVYTAQ